MFQKGFKHSERSKRKISKSLTGKKHSLARRKHKSKDLTGRKLSKEHIANVKLGMKNSKKWKSNLIKMARLARTPKRRRAQSEIAKRTICTPEVKAKLRKVHKSKAFRKKQSDIMLEKWKEKQYSEKMLKRLKKTHIRLGEGSGIQLSLFRALCRLGVSGIKLEFLAGGKFLDIANPKKKLDAEIDGKHWHKHRKRKDRRRDKKLRKLGWIVERFDASKRSLPKLYKFFTGKEL